MKHLKRTILTFVALLLTAWNGVYAADPDNALYQKALAAIEDDTDYFIQTDVNGTTFYVTASGFLTSTKGDAGIFHITKTSGGQFGTGFRIDGGKSTFTNPPKNGDVAKLNHGAYVRSFTNDRDDWERQVLFLNDEGKYAIRSCNTEYGEADFQDCGRTFWSYTVSDVVIPCYTYEPTYVWNFVKYVPGVLSWDAATPNTATIALMPFGNVKVSTDYFPQATADGAVTASTTAMVTTDDALVTVDETKLTGATTLMFFVSETDAAPAYDAQGWTSDVPTAKDYTEAKTVYVWYYPVGNDDADPAKTYSNGNMNATALAVVLHEPTYVVKFAEGTNPNEWSASPNTGVKKGQTVTITYTGPRKVMGMKAEKKTIINIEGMTLDITNCTTWRDVVTKNPDLLYISGNCVCRKPDGAMVYNNATQAPVDANQDIDTSASYFFMNIG